MSNDDGAFLEILIGFEKKIFRDLKVASLALITNIENDKVTAKPFPVFEGEEEKEIIIKRLNNDNDLKEGQIVCVLFLDKNFKPNLQSMKDGSNVILKTSKENLHNENYGIILKVY